MTHIEQAIGEAVRKGKYVADGDYEQETWAGWAERNRILLDPIFWQALGKARGWEKELILDAIGDPWPVWLYHWHLFIDHLAEGKDAESFFKDL